jgi:hypothetical protein
MIRLALDPGIGAAMRGLLAQRGLAKSITYNFIKNAENT